MQLAKPQSFTLCVNRWPMFLGREKGRNGNPVLVSDPSKSIAPKSPVWQRCGHCFGCKNKRSNDWTVKMFCESQSHNDSVWITLTYDDKNLPEVAPGVSCLVVNDVQKFLKRFRFEVEKLHGIKVRIAYCGEYGTEKGRPHWHIILFGMPFALMEQNAVYAKNAERQRFGSALLDRTWTLGSSEFSPVSPASIRYIANYIYAKKTGWTQRVPGDDGLLPYERVSPVTGEIVSITPEVFAASNRPGIGHDWFLDFKGDVFPDGVVRCGDAVYAAPPYFWTLLERHDPELFRDCWAAKIDAAIENQRDPNETEERRLARSQVAQEYSKLFGKGKKL